MMIKPSGIKYKIFLSYVIVILFSFGLIAYFLDKNLEQFSLSEIKSSLSNQALLVESQIPAQKVIDKDLLYLSSLTFSLAEKIKGRVTLIDRQGAVLADSATDVLNLKFLENHLNRPEVRTALGGKISEEIRYSPTLKTDMFYIAIPLKKDATILGVVRLALPMTRVKKELQVVRNTITFSFILAIILALAMGSLLSRMIVMPMKKIIHGARLFSAGEFGHKIMFDSHDEIGELVLVLNKMAQDIEDKISQIELNNQHLAAIFQSMIEGIIVTDKDSRILSINSPAENIFEIEKDKACGRLFIEAIANNDMAELISEVMEKGEFISKELVLSWPMQKIFRINASAIYEKEDIAGCLLIIHDITEARKAEVMRKDFVANVSHELKTPLTSIKGFVETLLEGALEDKENAKNFLGIIKDHADRLDNLVNDLLSLSYLESKQAVLVKQKIGLKKLVEETLSGFSVRLKEKSLKIKEGVGPDLIINADRDKIGQVLTNLIDNAIKFNVSGGTVEISADNIENGTRVVVSDTGIGIPQKDIPRIFERFYRVDRARSRQMGGTGLGLSIVRHIVELHGGRVGVESSEGSGSRFFFVLPV
ncbi:MAG TPA: ATP-binding protein [Candidatus Omnitrophota bacterium]|nr:ATP-binding protein [Candidatus Omnitrophota bacterium]